MENTKITKKKKKKIVANFYFIPTLDVKKKKKNVTKDFMKNYLQFNILSISWQPTLLK